MDGFQKEKDGIYRLKIPFENIYTSVFLISAKEINILVDCGTSAEDVDKLVVPSLRKMGIAASDLSALVLTHGHGDHAGGLPRILELLPGVSVIKDERRLSQELSTYALKGHTVDSIGLLDMRTHTLISGDGLQFAGIDKYPCYTQDPHAYLKTIENIKNDGRIENILFSHAYEPFLADSAIGRKKVEACLDECKRHVKERK